MLEIIGPNNTSEPLLGVNPDATIYRAINADYALSFTITKTENNAYSYPLVLEDSVITINEENFIVKALNEYPYSKQVTAVHEFFEIVDDFVESRLGDGAYTINNALIHAFSQTTDWTFVVDGTFNNAYLKEFGNDNPIALLQTIIETYGAEYTVSSKDKVVRIKKRLGIETDYQVRFKHNLVDIDKQIDVNNVKTAVKVYYNKDEFGEYANNVIYYSPNRNKYRRTKWATPLYLDYVTSQSEALAIAATQLNDMPVVSIACDFVHLQDAGYNANDIELGNSFYLIDERINLSDVARIVEIETYPLNKNKTPKIVTSNKRKTIIDLPIGQQKQHNTLNQQAVKTKEIYNGASLTDEEGLKISSRNNVVIWLNANEGILIENEGIKKFYVDTDGNVTFDGRLLITNGDGTTPLLEAFLDQHGGRLIINDDNGENSVRIGSQNNYSRRGGLLELFEEGDKMVELNSQDTNVGSGGVLRLNRNASNGQDVKLTTFENEIKGASLELGNGTYLSSTRGFINFEQIATMNWVRDYVDDAIRDLDTGSDDGPGAIV